MFRGSICALVTPFHEDMSVDYDSLCSLVNWHINAGTNGLVLCGTTGESATLSYQEKLNIFATATKAAAGQIPIIAGTGTNSTAFSIDLSLAAIELGISGLLVVTPYYNKPTQIGLYEHYKLIAKQCSPCPLIIYNVPSRTGTDILPETVFRLAGLDNIVGIKEASPGTNRLQQLLQFEMNNFTFLSGEDDNVVEFIRCGGHGVISVTSNVVPDLVANTCSLALQNDFAAATQLIEQLSVLNQSLFCQTNPIPVKWLLEFMGKISSSQLRLPLTKLEECYQQRVKESWLIGNKQLATC